MISRPDFKIKEGLVVTPSTMPKSFNSAIASISAVSTKNFMAYVLDRLAFVGASFIGVFRVLKALLLRKCCVRAPILSSR
jgi:preprotein translocase subunit SecY